MHIVMIEPNIDSAERLAKRYKFIIIKRDEIDPALPYLHASISQFAVVHNI